MSLDFTLYYKMRLFKIIFKQGGDGMENWMICSFSSPDLRRSLSDSHLSTNATTNENGNASTSVQAPEQQEKTKSMSQSA